MNGLDVRIHGRRRRVAAGLTALVVLAGLLASCVDMSEHLGAGLGVLNSTDVPLTFEYIYPGGTYDDPEQGTSAYPGGTYDPPGTTAPGERSLIIAANLLRGSGMLGQDGCTTGTLIARGPDGAEVARHGPGLCDTEAWEITREAASASP